MPAERTLPSDEARQLVATFREFAQTEVAASATQGEAAGEFPRELLLKAGSLGLLSLPYDRELGGGGQPYEVYLQALEEVAGPWMAFGVAASVHVMTCWAMSEHATDEQRDRLLKRMLSGTVLGAYGLSERQAGSDVAGITTAARRDGDDYVINGDKYWIGPAGLADYYIVFARVGEGRHPVSAFYVPGDADGLTFPGSPQKLGMNATPVGALHFADVRIPATNLIGTEGAGMRLALAGLDRGRLAIAAIATGVAQAALDVAVSYANTRRAFGSTIGEHQGLAFLLADMAAAVESARATYLAAARRRDLGLDFTRQAAVAKLVATDNAMRVCTDAVQVLGGVGYTTEYPVERYFREVKVTQIFEGTNQIQRMVIARNLLAAARTNS